MAKRTTTTGSTATVEMDNKADVAGRIEPAPAPPQLRPGQIVLPGTALPLGWEPVDMGHGRIEAWPTAEHAKGHPVRVDAKKRVLTQVDEAFGKLVPTKEFPDRPAPTRMLVNRSFRRMFTGVMSWGSSCPLFVADDETFPGEPYEAQFKFETA